MGDDGTLRVWDWPKGAAAGQLAVGPRHVYDNPVLGPSELTGPVTEATRPSTIRIEPASSSRLRERASAFKGAD